MAFLVEDNLIARFVRAPLTFWQYVVNLEILFDLLKLIAHQAFVISFGKQFAFSKVPLKPFDSFDPSFREIITIF
jgi:hypothetical protein